MIESSDSESEFNDAFAAELNPMRVENVWQENQGDPLHEDSVGLDQALQPEPNEDASTYGKRATARHLTPWTAFLKDNMRSKFDSKIPRVMSENYRKLQRHQRDDYVVDAEMEKRKLLLSENKFSCELCLKRFKHRRDLCEHMRSHDIQVEHRCSVCDKIFKTERTLRQHHNVHERKYACQVCPFSASNRSQLKIHQGSVHSSQIPCEVHVCSLCPGKNFKTKRDAKKHLVDVHVGELRNCPYPGCNYGSRKSGNLKSHEIRRHQRATSKDMMQADGLVVEDIGAEEEIWYEEVFPGCSNENFPKIISVRSNNLMNLNSK